MRHFMSQTQTTRQTCSCCCILFVAISLLLSSSVCVQGDTTLLTMFTHYISIHPKTNTVAIHSIQISPKPKTFPITPPWPPRRKPQRLRRVLDRLTHILFLPLHLLHPLQRPQQIHFIAGLLHWTFVRSLCGPWWGIRGFL